MHDFTHSLALSSAQHCTCKVIIETSLLQLPSKFDLLNTSAQSLDHTQASIEISTRQDGTLTTRPHPPLDPRKSTSDQRPGRCLSDHSQSHFFPPLAHYAANASLSEHQAVSACSKDPHPCLHGLWCWSRTLAMGQGTGHTSGQDPTHEGRRRSILAARDSG